MSEDPGAAPPHDGVADPCGRAYSGPLHGMQWSLGGPVPPPVLDLSRGEVRVRYRLVRHPRSRRAIRDDRGSYVYVPDQAG